MSKREQKKAENCRKLIEATIDSIAKHGLTSTTVSTVVEGAGLSRGIVNLRFQSKDALLNQTLRYLAEEWRSAWKRALERSGSSPVEQLRATLMVVFDAPVFGRKRLSVWHAFWADSTHRDIYKSVCGASDREYRRVLTRLCREICAESNTDGRDPALMADSLAALVSGLWLDLLTIPRTVTKHRARAMCSLVLAQMFPEHVSVLTKRAA